MSVIASFSAATNYPAAEYNAIDGLALNGVNYMSGLNQFEGNVQLVDFDYATASPQSAVTVAGIDGVLANAALLLNDNVFTAQVDFNKIQTPYPVDDGNAATLGYLNDQIKGKDAATLSGTQEFTGDNAFNAGLNCSSLTAATSVAPTTTNCNTASTQYLNGSGSVGALLVTTVASNDALLYGYPQGFGYWTKLIGGSQNYIGNTNGDADADISIFYTVFFNSNVTTNCYLTFPAVAHIGQKINVVGLGDAPIGFNFNGDARWLTNNSNVVATTLGPITLNGSCLMAIFRGTLPTIDGNLPVWSYLFGT